MALLGESLNKTYSFIMFVIQTHTKNQHNILKKKSYYLNFVIWAWKEVPVFEKKNSVKGTVHSTSIWAKSLANGFLMIVLYSRFSLKMPVGPVIFKIVFYRSTIFGSIVINLASIIIIFGSIVIILGSIVIILGSIAIIFETIDPNIMLI